MSKKRVFKKTWAEFHKTGLLLFINTFLHIFGWAIVIEYDNEKIKSCYPAKVKFRGFDYKSTENAYIRLSQFMVKNANRLLKEIGEV